MKKLIVVAAVIVVFASTVSAQEKLSFGVKGGMNLAKISNMDVDFQSEDYYFFGDASTNFDTKIRPAFYAGAFIEYKFNDLLAISPEFVISSQGVKGDLKAKFDLWGESYDVKWKATQSLTYLNIPIMAKIYVAEAFSIDVGPQFGFLMSAKAKTEDESGLGDIEMEEDNGKEDFNTFDMAIGIGATYNIGHFMIQGRYNLGLTDIVKDKPSDWKAMKNNVFQIGVGYRF